MKTKNKLYILIIFGLVLRLVKLSTVYSSSDVIQLPFFVIDSFPTSINSFFQLSNFGIGNPLRLFVYPYSILQPVLYFLIVGVYTLFKINITPGSLVFPTAFIGAITLIPLYYLIKEVSDKKIAFIACIFLSILPCHLLQSRYISAARVLSFLLQILTIYFLLLYLKLKNKKYFRYSSIFLSLFILSTIMFPPFLGVVFFVFFVHYWRHNLFLALKKSVVKLFDPNFILLPFLALSGLVVEFIIASSMGTKFGNNVTMVGHLLTKEKIYGFFIFEILVALKENLGVAIGILLLFSLILGFKHFYKLDKVSLFLFWGLAYLLPFLFTKTSILRVYFMYAAIPLMLFTVLVFIHKSRLYPTFRNLVLVIVLFMTLLTSVSTTYNLQLFNLIDLETSEGSFYPDIGLRVLGTWVRENTAQDSIIFTDNNIEPPVAKFYFHRTVYSLFDSDFSSSYNFFIKHQSEIDYVVISPDHLVSFPDFNVIIKVKLDGEDSLLLLAKENKDVLILNVADGEIFNEKYANLFSLKNAPNYVSQFPAWI